jgi:hypothetical protein
LHFRDFGVVDKIGSENLLFGSWGEPGLGGDGDLAFCGHVSFLSLFNGVGEYLPAIAVNISRQICDVERRRLIRLDTVQN